MFLRVLLCADPDEPPRPVTVELDDGAPVSVGDVLAALGRAPAATAIDGLPVDPSAPARSSLAHGAIVAALETGRRPPRAVARVAVIAGPDAGRVVDVDSSPLSIGRATTASAVISDRTVSRRHLDIDVSPSAVVVRDAGSVNGSMLERSWITTPTAVTADSLLHLGRSSVRVDGATNDDAPAPVRDGRVMLVRPPRALRADHPPITLPSTMSAASRRVAIDVAAVAVPVLFAIVMAVVFDPRFALMGAAGPLIATINHLTQRRRARRDDRQRALGNRAALAQFHDELAAAQQSCRRDRRDDAPDLGEIARRIHHAPALLWERRANHDDFLALSVGFGTIEWSPRLVGDTNAITDDVRAVLGEFAMLEDVPIVIDARTTVGVCGSEAAALAVVRALVVQAAALHGPADLRIVVATTAERHDHWQWTTWLPHAHDHRADVVFVLGDDARRREIVDHLLASATDDDVAHTLVVVDESSLVADRTTPLRQLLTGLPGASAIVLASPTTPLPALCQTVIDVDDDMDATVSQPARASVQRGIRAAGVSHDTAIRAAARLARFTDPEATTAAVSLPLQVGLRSLLTAPSGHLSITERWGASRDTNSFVVPIGVDADGPFLIDLVHDGPHVLVAGTTGSGKSELLRTLITALAATIDTQRINFLLVDYKGGSAFDRCRALPHTVGVVTDLDAHTTARALVCLEAELRHRERALRDAGVDDIAQYHALVRGGRAPLPRLVVVVDEFASLVADLPRFVDSLIDVGQRGRSLGVHLVLATQRPAGVVSESLRANTNLRISLRVLEPNDSRDVIGVTAAAFLSRRQPGRAIARLGAAEVVPFHAATVTGCSPARSSEPVRIVDPSHSPIDETASVSDLARLVVAINEAHLAEGHAPPRRPWPDPLPATVALDALDAHAPDDDAPLATEVAYGLGDAPHEQRLVRVTWSPHRGPLLVHSLRGGGATTTLSTIAVALARAHAPSELYLYVLDLGPGDLAPLADLHHCGAYVTASETERGTRLLRWLDAEVRTRGGPAPSERDGRPLVVLVVDQIGTIAATEHGEAWREALRRLVADGAAVGVHVVLSTDRAGALGHATDALIEQRLLLRLAEPVEYAAIGRRGIDPSALPPGRGFLTPSGREVQVALPDRRGLAAAVAAIEQKGGERRAPPIGVLSSDLALSDVRASAATSPPGWIIGLYDHTLTPAALVLAPGDHALIAGPARSGKSNALAVIADEARRSGAHVHVLASARSPLHGHAIFGAALTPEELRSLVDRLTTDEPGGPAHVIVVDDADLFDDEGELERLLAARPLHVHVIASARGDRLRATFRHWTAEIRRSRTGLLLKPDELDGELLGVRLPRGTASTTSGRGYLVTDQGVELVQVARIDPTAATIA